MIEGIARESISKNSIKELRDQGYLIANIYAKGFKNIHAAFKENEFIKAMRRKETIQFPIKVDGKEIIVVVQEYQKHPVTNRLLHVDLKVALPGVVTSYMVPVKTVGTPIGLKNKGVLILSKKRLHVKCAIENLPQAFELDISSLDVGGSFLVRDVVAPEGVRIMDEDRVAILGVVKAK